jgi:hypothetical protein
MKHVDYAKQKVESVIETINFVRELDFPYEDPLEAVNFIRTIFQDHQKHLNNISTPSTARSLCKQVSKDIDDFLLAIGFIVRACDVRGALELQGPLRRLTHRAIGSDVKLIISSEWRYSPFTLLYPGDFGDEFALVGLPVSEAENPLIAPLAGHELGHNIWCRLPILQQFVGQEVRNKVVETIKTDEWGKFTELFNVSSKEQLDQEEELLAGVPYWKVQVQVAELWGVSQCEEMFCDFIGLSIFGEGYLHAFQYLISPGGGFRNPAYPNMPDRVNALVQAAKFLGLTISERFAEEFDEPDISSDPTQQLLLKISDKASRYLVDNLIQVAKQFCENTGIAVNHDNNEVDRIFESFKKVVPATGATSLANIINAAWRIFLDTANYWATDYPITVEKPEKRIELIRELALKSFEVFEIERIQEEGQNASISK